MTAPLLAYGSLFTISPATSRSIIAVSSPVSDMYTLNEEALTFPIRGGAGSLRLWQCTVTPAR